MKILIGGDFAPREQLGKLIKEGKCDFFSPLHHLTQEADYSILNMEAPFVLDSDSPIIKWGPNLKAPVETVNVLRNGGFNIVTLANNHINDYGGEALLRTKQICEQNGILTVGAGASDLEARKPLILTNDDHKLAIINCCEYEFSITPENLPGANHLDPISIFNEIQELKSVVERILIIVHGGHEEFNLPSVRMQKLYRFFIDAGADAVVNHHQHCYSGYEIYHNRPIFYGLGNLLFDDTKPYGEGWFLGYLLSMNFDKEIIFEIYPYRQCYGNIGIELLDNNAFDSKLHELNRIIEDPAKLESHVQKYYKESANYSNLILNPYTNKYIIALKERGLLPSLLSDKYKLRLKNHLFCESHLDKIKSYLS